MDQMFLATGNGRPPKRQKTAVACNNCRSRKVRCGGEAPFCTTCIARNETSTCAYQAPASEIAEKQTQKPGLRQHEAQVEDSHDILLTSAPSEHGRTHRDVDWNGNSIAPTLSPSSVSLWDSGLSIAHRSPAQRSNQSMPASLHLSYLPKDEIGLTNSGSFLKTVLGAATENNNESRFTPRSRRQSPARTLADLGAADYIHKPSLQSEDLLLPPRREVQRLLDVYRRVHYAILPLVDLPGFLADVSAVFDGADPPANQQTLHCLLNFMFALAVQGQTSPQCQGEDPVTPFFARARNLMTVDLLDGWSFAQLQETLICAQFLLSTDRPQQCWLLVGLCIRIAEGLGLQRSSTALDLKRPEERALSRRVWHCCVAIDRTVAMCLGQAPTVGRYATSFVKLDAVKPGTDSTIVSDEETAHSFFKASSELFDILHEILTMIYTPDGKDPSEKILLPPSLPATVIVLEEKLDEWERCLPTHLKVLEAEADGVNSSRLFAAHFLRQRYLQVCIMLYRPGLAARVLSQRDTFRASQRKLKQSTLFYSASACVQSAQNLISLCRKQANPSPESLMVTPWWMNVLYAYTAATAIAAAMLDTELHEKQNSPSLNDSMDDVVNILTDYSSQHPIASRCISTLTSINRPRNPSAPDNSRSVTFIEQPDQAPRPFFQTEAACDVNHEMDCGYGVDFTIDDRYNPIFDFLSDQWLAQPQLDSFDFLGVQSLC